MFWLGALREFRNENLDLGLALGVQEFLGVALGVGLVLAFLLPDSVDLVGSAFGDVLEVVARQFVPVAELLDGGANQQLGLLVFGGAFERRLETFFLAPT